jgi:acyl-CoA thioesterase
VNELWDRDVASQALGMRLELVEPGRSTVRMPVRADMLNGHAICHGGFVFCVADTAFAMACNARGPETVAAAAHIEFLAPAREGDELVAVAVERTDPGRRSGVYDVRVETAQGVLIALFRGRSHRTGVGAGG